MATQKRMDQIRAILGNYLISGKVKVTARQLKISKNTLKEYVRRAEGYSAPRGLPFQPTIPRERRLLPAAPVVF